SNVNGEAVFYTYRADGLRDKTTKTGVMGSTVPVSETKFVWDGANIVAEMDGNNSVTTRYVRGIGLLLSDDGIGLKFYLYNGHGDVVQLADGSGNVVKAYDFDIFGNERDLDTNDTNPFRYCAEYFDANTGAYYLRARYYQPFTGRFLTEDSLAYVDPDDPLSLNLYTYCHNNPIRFIDPSGHFVSNWDRTHLIVWELKRLQYMTDNWDYVTVLQQNEWRFEAEQMRAKYRAPYEYTDSSGITWVDVAKFIEYEKNNPPVSTSNGYGNFVVAAGIAATVDGPLPFGDAIGLGILGIGTIIVYANVDNLDKTVNEVLKTKKGNIRKAPLPPGSPGWAEIGALTMEQIRRLAQQNATGFKTFWKLLHEIRFNK
ncbi:MAG: RHS repeat-associated core domain-containing protein, partial [Firmicutes bacterium]|nr:RHS repeat-associated core domain-containing protein [Bacillota bacterium]